MDRYLRLSQGTIVICVEDWAAARPFECGALSGRFAECSLPAGPVCVEIPWRILIIDDRD